MNENQNGPKEAKTKADILFDAVSGIDDVFILQAVEATPKKKRFPVIPVLAACLALAVCLYPAARLVKGMLRIASRTKKDALSELLLQKKDSGCYLTCTESQLSLRDGIAKLIWQYDGSKEYCVVELDNQSFTLLTQTVGADGIPFEVEGNVSKPECRVWVSNGIGVVVTPYLKVEKGNISYGNLPEYEPELLPGKTVVNIIGQAVSA